MAKLGWQITFGALRCFELIGGDSDHPIYFVFGKGNFEFKD